MFISENMLKNIQLHCGLYNLPVHSHLEKLKCKILSIISLIDQFITLNDCSTYVHKLLIKCNTNLFEKTLTTLLKKAASFIIFFLFFLCLLIYSVYCFDL